MSDRRAVHRFAAAPLMLLWFVSLGFEIGAQITLKIGSTALADLPLGMAWAATVATSPWILVSVACDVGSFISWLLILRQTTLSLAFPMTALCFIGVVGASWTVLGESIGVARLVGCAVIVAGVLCLGDEDE